MKNRNIKIYSKRRIAQAYRKEGRLYFNSAEALSLNNHIYDA